MRSIADYKQFISILMPNVEEFDYETKAKIAQLSQSLTNSISLLIEQAIEHQIWDESIEKIVVTNNYYDDIQKQCEIYDIRYSIALEREYQGVSKELFNKNLDQPKSKPLEPNLGE